MDYKGYVEIQLDDNKLASFYGNKDVYIGNSDFKYEQGYCK